MHRNQTWDPEMWREVYGRRWEALADSGLIVLPRKLQCEAFHAVQLQLLKLLHEGRQQVKLLLNCDDGDDSCFRLEGLFARFALSHVHVTERAYSAGLIAAIAASHRTCEPGALFLHHGDDLRCPEEDDAMLSSYMARHTTMPQEFWLERCRLKAPFEFDAERALEYGVVQEIVEDVPFSVGY